MGAAPEDAETVPRDCAVLAIREARRQRPSGTPYGEGDVPSRTLDFPGDGDEGAGLYRIDVAEGPGGHVRIANAAVPPAFRESVNYAEQNLYARARELVGDRDPRQHELTVQLRAFDAGRNGAQLGMAALLAFCGALLGGSIKGGLVIVGGLNLGGGLDPVHDAVSVAELAVEKGAQTLLIPVSARRQLFDLSDDMATKLTIEFYADAREALLKALGE
ncbi:MAG: hypothetical protein IT337_07720 [Thermomicrobiales bacterium]|nr:hypothetical protein [Thermomicrobiales bacterium]